MNKVAHYLQEHLVGEVMTSADVRKYFSTDASIFAVTPLLVVYPRNENDIRKTTRFTWQLAERGRIIPVTPRGAGTDLSGAALGSGVIMAFPAHMNRVLELDSKSGVVTVEPGIIYGKLQQTLHTHNRFLPPFPASFEYSTVGGAVGNNAAGEKSIKYGSTRDFVKRLRVVLANGEVIETKRLNKRELGKKLGLSTFEGEIYRTIDTLIEENKDLVKSFQPAVTKNAAGYALDQVKRKDGSFDLTPLLVGSQGTLGIVTEVSLETEPHNPNTVLIAAMFDDIQVATQAMQEFRKLTELPSAMELVDEHLLKFVQQTHPNLLRGVIEEPLPKLVLLVEFDNASERIQKRMTKKATRILKKYQIPYRMETDAHKKEELWKIRHSAATVIAHNEGNAKAVPIIEDGVVPVERFGEFLQAVYELFARAGLQAAVWGHAGDANVHMQPFLDLSQVGDRQKAFKLIDEYYRLVIQMGGSTSGEHGDGRLRAPYLPAVVGDQAYELLQKVKKAFDPYGTLNPGVKIDVTLNDIKALVRSSYSLDHLYDHMPRT
ncbi:MAG TPA: FAD-binding oxidoreductase [Candidatus Limnocylindria bacterium]|nr:FAD-binding oxidoreductase [Candidatus Limnocylindria bacterium]